MRLNETKLFVCPDLLCSHFTLQHVPLYSLHVNPISLKYGKSRRCVRVCDMCAESSHITMNPYINLHFSITFLPCDVVTTPPCLPVFVCTLRRSHVGITVPSFYLLVRSSTQVSWSLSPLRLYCRRL